MEVGTGVINPVSKVDCCTPDWFPDSRTMIYSSRPHEWTQLWMADGEGKERRLVYAEDGRHIYGGCVSPDGKYVLFTGNKEEDGDPKNAGAPMGLLRLRDAPTITGVSHAARKEHPGRERRSGAHSARRVGATLDFSQTRDAKVNLPRPILPDSSGTRHGDTAAPASPTNRVAQPSRLRVRAASRRSNRHRAGTPGKLAGEDACATPADGSCRLT